MTNLRRFDHEGLRQLQNILKVFVHEGLRQLQNILKVFVSYKTVLQLTKTFVVERSYIYQLLSCYMFAQESIAPLTYLLHTMSLHDITHTVAGTASLPQ